MCQRWQEKSGQISGPVIAMRELVVILTAARSPGGVQEEYRAYDREWQCP